MIAFGFFTMGCCCALTPEKQSGFCPYGTYGSACSKICSDLNQGEGCTSKCMDDVKAAGLGDATTCCKATFRQDCDTTCTNLEKSTHGDTTKIECMDECLAVHTVTGLDLDSCSLPV